MAGYVSIETIVPCHDEETLQDLVQRYLHILVSLGIGEPGYSPGASSCNAPSGRTNRDRMASYACKSRRHVL